VRQSSEAIVPAPSGPGPLTLARRAALAARAFVLRPPWSRRSSRYQAMQAIQQLSLTWMHRPPSPQTGQPLEPLALPDRVRIRRLAEIYHEQMVEARSETGRVGEVARLQSEALRQFMIELTEKDAGSFINAFTEESSALEREWEIKQSAYTPPGELSPEFLGAFVYILAVIAIGLAIAYTF